jgi:DNA-binding transcriptional LysR family regulator
MDKIFKANNIEVKKVAEFDNIETIKRAVEVGFGLAIVPEPAVSEAKKAGSLAVIQLAEKYWIRSVGVIHRSDRNLSLAAKKFVELLSKPNLK